MGNHHKIIKGCHVAFSKEPSKKVIKAICTMIDRVNEMSVKEVPETHKMTSAYQVIKYAKENNLTHAETRQLLFDNGIIIKKKNPCDHHFLIADVVNTKSDPKCFYCDKTMSELYHNPNK